MTKTTFSQEVKNELCEVKIKEFEAVAELAAMVLFGENITDGKIRIRTDKADIAARLQVVLRKAAAENISIDIVKGKRSFCIEITSEIAEKAGVYFSEDGEIALDEDVYENDDAKRAFLRGAFIISGTITDPLKGYCCELLTYNENMSYLAAEMLENFGIKANTVKRNNYYVTYLKDKNSVADFLNIVGAHRLMMELMVTQIEKDLNNRNNRASNCQAANLDKAISASAVQCNAIIKLRDLPVWDSLDEETKELARLRLEYFDLPLSGIGEKMNPKMTKSSVNRRMKKLVELANERIQEA